MITVRLRQWHSYIGLFIAPSVIFFSLTGALQLFSLHEAHGTYQPPAILEKLASVHKDQVLHRAIIMIRRSRPRLRRHPTPTMTSPRRLLSY